VKRPELTTYRLRFPSEIAVDGVLAAFSTFSGLPYGTRLRLDLAADQSGITHTIGISQATGDVVAAVLRAVLPSVQLTAADTPAPVRGGRRSMWQPNQPTGLLRSDDLEHVSAALLASLTPLSADESIRLTWHLRPSGRPTSGPPTAQQRHEGQAAAVRQKLALAGLQGWGELAVNAATSARQRTLQRRIGTVLHSLATAHGHLAGDGLWLGRLLRLVGLRGRYLNAREIAAVVGWPLGTPDLPGLELGAAKRLVASAALARDGRVLGISNVPGVARPVAVTARASTRGTWILGATGTGKTTLLHRLIRADIEQGRGVAVIESNGDLIADLLDTMETRVDDVVLIDPTDREMAVGFNPLAGGGSPSLIADQISELFGRIWAQFWGPRTAQLAHMGLLTLAQRPGSTLVDLPRLYTDPAFRSAVLVGLDDPVGLEPEWRRFLALAEREQALTTAPLLNKARQFVARSSIRAIVGQAKPAISMREIVEQRKVVFVNLPKGLLGTETATLLGCLILTSLWLAMAERAGQPRATRDVFGLYVDEVQDFASAPIPWDEMYSQGRKYGLATTTAHQHLQQLPKEVREVILANARTKAVFALGPTDAKALEPIFGPALTARDLQSLDAHSLAAIVALDDGSSSRPVTLDTLPPLPASGTSDRVRSASHGNYARPITEVETTLRGQAAVGRTTGSAPIGRQRRAR
jgi:hypothetical protein